MKEIIEYLGKEIEVDEEVKICLEELDRKEDSLARKNRRHELLWDSTLVGMDGEIIRQAVEELDELDRGIIIDRFFKQMKFRELAEKYGMASSSIETWIKRVLKMRGKMI